MLTPVGKPSLLVENRSCAIISLIVSHRPGEMMEVGTFLSTSKCRHKSEGFGEMDNMVNSQRNSGATV